MDAELLRKQHKHVVMKIDFQSAFRGKRVFITGHTGFKGAWLCQWLLKLGAQIRGYALDPPTNPSLFNELGLENHVDDIRNDIRDLSKLNLALTQFSPDFVFHLAAQPLVRYSYQAPVENYSTNVMGTIHVLESLRALTNSCVAIIVTTDKCYENREWVYGYREDDPLGGADPYSSSKAMAELAVASYRRSFFTSSKVSIASVRAGNVVGGGDWASDRIVPDCIRALKSKNPIAVRNPHARRPWQHVLDPLSGYLSLAAQIEIAKCLPGENFQKLQNLCSGFNFGPDGDSNRTVGELVENLLETWPGHWMDQSDPHAVHEAQLLHLTTDKARHVLGWSPTWDFKTTIRETAKWYLEWNNGRSASSLILEQIAAFENAAY
ncbi:MAG: CDP-glucose 4,6-dehydratase [Pirellulales bacterium]